VLRNGLPCHLAYQTRFFVSWPEHLGGGHVFIDFVGAMTLRPILAV